MGFPGKTRQIALAATTGIALLIAACGGGATAGGNQTLLLGHGADPGNPRTLAADAFAKEVSEESGGRISVQVQGSEQLGSDVEMLQSVRAGTLDITANSQGPLSAMVPQVGLLGLPFLFADAEQAYQVLDGEVGDELGSFAEDKGFKILAWWDNGIRHVTNGKRPINTPADLRGLKIRTPEDPMTVDIFKAFNANPTPLAFGELYLALRQGTVDGQENPLTNIASAKLNEVQKHLALTGHKYEVTPFVMNLDKWNGLSQEDKKIVQKAAENARDQQRRLMQEQDEELRKTLAEHMAITEPDRDALRAETKSVYDKWSAKYGDLVDKLVEASS